MERLAKWGRRFGAIVDGWVLGDTGSPGVPPGREVDVESITESKREWMENQQSVNTRELSTWPDHLFECFVIAGLPPDMEITQIAEDLCEKEHRAAGVEDAAKASTSAPAGGLLGSGVPADRRAAANVRAPPWPAYEPNVIYRYPGPAAQSAAAAELSDKEIASLCFPNNVPPRKLKRSPSWSALHRVVVERQRGAHDGRTFIFMLKVGASLPMYGVCCYVDEILHRPPLLARENFPSCNGPFRQCLIAAPRCYCLVSRYPFFTLHLQVLGKLLDIEHLNRVVQFNAEVAELSALTSRVVAAPASAQGEQKSSTASAMAQTSATCTTEQLLAAGVGTASMAAAAAAADKGPRSGLNTGQDVGAEQLQAGTAVQAGPSAAQAASAKQDIFQRMSQAYGSRDLSSGRPLQRRLPPGQNKLSGQSKKATRSLEAVRVAKSGRTGCVQGLQRRQQQQSPDLGASSSQAAAAGAGQRDEQQPQNGLREQRSAPAAALQAAMQELEAGPSTGQRQQQQQQQCTEQQQQRDRQPTGGPDEPATPRLARCSSGPPSSYVEPTGSVPGPLTPLTVPSSAFVSAPASPLSHGRNEHNGQGSPGSARLATASSGSGPHGAEPVGVQVQQAGAASGEPCVPQGSPTMQANRGAEGTAEAEAEAVPGPSSEDSTQRPTAGTPSEQQGQQQHLKQQLHTVAPPGCSAEPPGSVLHSAESFHLEPQQLLDQVFAAEVPTPGDPLVLRLSGMSAFPSTVTTLQFIRPQLPGRYTVVGTPNQLQVYAESELAACLQNWTLTAACRLLSLDNILAMLTAALLEQQIVVFCPDVAACSALVLSLVPMLRPYSLQGLILPVTPASLMSFIDAPVPFVLGLQYKTPEIQARCTDLVRVNVYKDQVSNAVSLPQLPALKELRAALLPHYQVLRKTGTAGGELVCSATHPLTKEEEVAAGEMARMLYAHLVQIVGDLRPHVITNVNLGKRTSMLMKGSLVESSARTTRAFIAAFVETQLFSVWCDQMLSLQTENS